MIPLEYIEKFIPKNDDDLHGSKPITTPHVREAITEKELTFGLQPNVSDDM